MADTKTKELADIVKDLTAATSVDATGKVKIDKL